jgi:hypothetical protein
MSTIGHSRLEQLADQELEVGRMVLRPALLRADGRREHRDVTPPGKSRRRRLRRCFSEGSSGARFTVFPEEMLGYTPSVRVRGVKDAAGQTTG